MNTGFTANRKAAIEAYKMLESLDLSSYLLLSGWVTPEDVLSCDI